MLLIIEEGTMPPGANSYASIADADAWHLARRSTFWPQFIPSPEEGEESESPTDPNAVKKEAALIKAADYLNGLQWKGRRAAQGRVMAWPRLDVVDADQFAVPSNIVPQNVVYAQCYLAGVIYGGTDVQPILERGGRIASESVGSLSTSYFDDAPNSDVHMALVGLLGALAVGLDGVKGKMSIGRMSLA